MNLRRYAFRALGASVSSIAAFALVAACGGKTVDTGTSSGTSTSSTQTGSSSSSRSTGSGSHTAGSSSGSSGGECTTISLGPSDTTCASDDDCTSVTTGDICPTSCQCGGTAANNAAASRIEGELAQFPGGGCPCPAEGTPRCVAGQCTLCGGFLQNTSACDGGLDDVDGGFDASPDGDFTGTFTDDAGATCVDIDLSTFDQTCHTANDCISIFTGPLCVPSDCPCQSAFINASGQARYDEAVNSLPASAVACSCPDVGPPACIGGMCVASGP